MFSFAFVQNSDFVLGLVLFPLWLLVAFVLGTMATRKTVTRVKQVARYSLLLIILAELGTLARVATFLALASYGWIFSSDRKLYSITLTVIPALVVLFVSLPRLVRVLRDDIGAPADAPSDATRAALSRPGLVLAVQAVAATSSLGCLERYLPPDLPITENFLIYSVIMILVIAVIAAHAARRSGRFARKGLAWRTRRRMWSYSVSYSVVLLLVISGLFVVGQQLSKFPYQFSMMEGRADFGGGPTFATDMGANGGPMPAMPGMTNVDQLTGDNTSGTPNDVFTLTAAQTTLHLSSGATVTAWAFNNQVPGPTLTVHQGDLVQITLINKLPSGTPVTIHWHGVDVPNASDGVAGVTQNAVAPGQSYVYRFRVTTDVGTRWYHSHELGSVQILRGLFGPLVILPRVPAPPVDQDMTAMFHTFTTDKGSSSLSINNWDSLKDLSLATGKRVRVRLINTDNVAATVAITGVPYQVVAMDGADVNKPTDLNGDTINLAAGAKYDVEFTMPSTPVRIAAQAAPSAGMAFSPDGTGSVPANFGGPQFDPFGYGSPEPTPITPDTHFTRHFNLVFDEWLGFYDDKFGLRQTANGAVFPNSPMLLVSEGDTVEITYTNRGSEDHPMHLHGHHVTVLDVNGKPVTGSPVVVDTVNVHPGETISVGFVANNPGVWMFHCHNLDHANLGLVMHLVYQGVYDPYLIGGPTDNNPD